MIKAWFWGLSPALLVGFGVLGGILLIVIVILKGVSLWYAARSNQKAWFIILLIVNTLGILELIYLIFASKKVKLSQGPTIKA